MSLLTILLRLSFVLAILAHLSTASYTLEDDYQPSDFFSKFSFFTDTDPTNGFVKYVDQSTAEALGLIATSEGSAYIGVDHTTNGLGGRASVRLTSTKSYNHGLIIADIAHMPGGICGTWPAFWTVGPNWPNGGEIDIIEGVNSQSQNDMTLHTSPGCSITNNGGFSGAITATNCDANVAGNTGCQIVAPDSNTFGKGFNLNGGGVYATEWTSDAISIWFFPRGSIPSDVSSGAPVPSSWGRPVAEFQGDCKIDTFFKAQQIVFDTTFCGDWAGNTWSSSICSSMASTCEAYVQNTPSAFKDAYWSVNSLKVYQLLATSERMFVNGTTSSMSLSVAVATKTALTGSVNGSLSRTIANTSSEAGLGGHFSTLPSGANTMSNKTSAQPSVATAKVTLNSTHSAYGNSSGSVTVSAGLGTAIMQAKSSTLLHARPIYTLPALSASYIASGDEYETVGIPPSSARRRHAGHLLSHRKRHWN